MVLLYFIIIFIANSDLTFSENETLAFNTTAVDEILTFKINLNTSKLNDTAVTDYLYGDSGINDQIDLSDFEPDEVKMLLETVQVKEELMEREFNKSRKYYNTEGYFQNSYFVRKFMEFMQQSIYGTRYRLKDTMHLRKYYSNDVAYNVAILYGSLMQIRIKLDNMFMTLRKLQMWNKFIWFIGLYERCLATTIDANFMVERIFAMKQELEEDMGMDTHYIEMANPNKNRVRPEFPPPPRPVE